MVSPRKTRQRMPRQFGCWVWEGFMSRGHGGFVERHRVRIASVLVVTAASASLVAYAVSVRGFAAHHPQLNDGGIWVTRGQHSQFGRLNKPINQLDGYVFTPDNVQQDDLDVLQDGAAVVGLDGHGDDAYPIDGSGLATLDKVCAVPCEEHSALKKAVARYKANGNKYVAEAW